MDTEECLHENVEYVEGNYVPPFGWEQRPGYFCEDCDAEMDAYEPDPDVRWED